MSMTISGIGSNSILTQLQNMQRQMNSLSQSAGTGVLPSQQPFATEKTNNIVKSVAGNAISGNADTVQTKVGTFENLLKDAFEEVNSLQNAATNMQTRFDSGDRSLSLSDVMLASQKSSISFEATLQVRNKLIEAYKTVSQMQI